jgi:hypothetical protein
MYCSLSVRLYCNLMIPGRLLAGRADTRCCSVGVCWHLALLDGTGGQAEAYPAARVSHVAAATRVSHVATGTPELSMDSSMASRPSHDKHRRQQLQHQLTHFWNQQVSGFSRPTFSVHRLLTPALLFATIVSLPMQWKEMEQATDFRNHNLPLARIKKIMKLDEEVRVRTTSPPLPCFMCRSSCGVLDVGCCAILCR